MNSTYNAQQLSLFEPTPPPFMMWFPEQSFRFDVRQLSEDEGMSLSNKFNDHLYEGCSSDNSVISFESMYPNALPEFSRPDGKRWTPKIIEFCGRETEFAPGKWWLTRTLVFYGSSGFGFGRDKEFEEGTVRCRASWIGLPDGTKLQLLSAYENDEILFFTPALAGWKESWLLFHPDCTREDVTDILSEPDP